MDEDYKPQTLEEIAFDLAVYSKHLPDDLVEITPEFTKYYNIGLDVRVIWIDIGSLANSIPDFVNGYLRTVGTSEQFANTYLPVIKSRSERAQRLYAQLNQIDNDHPEISKVLDYPSICIYQNYRVIEEAVKKVPLQPVEPLQTPNTI